MIKKAQKKAFFLLGILLTSFIGVLTSNLRANSSKDQSLFITSANADLGGTWTYASYGGSGCGGCCDPSDPSGSFQGFSQTCSPTDSTTGTGWTGDGFGGTTGY